MNCVVLVGLGYLPFLIKDLQDFFVNELATIQPKHLTFCDGLVQLFVPRSETDVYIEGNYVYIAKLENKYCPVAILRKYIEAANLDLSSHLPLFRPLTKNKSVYSLRNGKLSYTRCRELFKTTLKDLGYDPKEYGLHSLRSGGATAVISNNASKAVSETLLNRRSERHVRFRDRT